MTIASQGIATKLFCITDIPYVMQSRYGWHIAARLMRRWFGGPSYQMTRQIKENWDGVPVPSYAVEESIVRMAWLMKFPRVSNAAQTLRATWDSPEGRKELLIKINRARPAGQTSWRFGDLAKPASEVDKSCQVNIYPIGNFSDPLDEFYGAIGRGTLKIAASGMATRLNNGRTRVEIEDVGLYLRDTYDFNDDGQSIISQPLGYWGWTGVQRNPQLRWDIEIEPKTVEKDVPRDRLYAVQNDDFRAWRKRYGRGCDFVIYSDVQRFKLSRPKVFEL